MEEVNHKPRREVQFIGLVLLYQHSMGMILLTKTVQAKGCQGSAGRGTETAFSLLASQLGGVHPKTVRVEW